MIHFHMQRFNFIDFMVIELRFFKKKKKKKKIENMAKMCKSTEFEALPKRLYSSYPAMICRLRQSEI